MGRCLLPAGALIGAKAPDGPYGSYAKGTIFLPVTESGNTLLIHTLEKVGCKARLVD
jgi:hypothetical protein